MSKVDQSIKHELECYAKYVPLHVAVKKVKAARLNRFDRKIDAIAKDLA